MRSTREAVPRRRAPARRSASRKARTRKSRSASEVVGAIEPVEERGDLEQARPVLDEVLVDELAARLG